VSTSGLSLGGDSGETGVGDLRLDLLRLRLFWKCAPPPPEFDWRLASIRLDFVAEAPQGVPGGVCSWETPRVTIIIGGNAVETGNPSVAGSTAAPDVVATAAGATVATVGAGGSTLGSRLEGTETVAGVLG
jgi:hypothetical protein